MKSKYDVVVVGAGLAGLHCAHNLATKGADVLLLDRKHSLDQRVHTTGIFVRRTLENFSLPEDCLGPAIRDVTLFSPKGRSLELHSHRDEFRIGKMAKLYNRYLDNCIDAGVEWLPGAAYRGSLPMGDYSRLYLNIDDERLRIDARIIVGADGVQSKVASDLELESNSEWIVGVEDVYHDVEFNGNAKIFCFLDPVLAPGYIAWAVTDGEETHIGAGGYVGRFDPLFSLSSLRKVLTPLMPGLENARPVERRAGKIPVGGVLSHIATERGLLIGDAAGAVSPLTAGGLDPCLRLSQHAADVILGKLSGDVSSLSAVYSGDLFRRKFRKRLWMRQLIKHARNPFFFEAGVRVGRMPIVNNVIREIFFGDGSFPSPELAGATLRSIPEALPVK